METHGIFLDTSFVIAAIRGNLEASATISKLRKTTVLFISSIARAELFHGAFKKGDAEKLSALHYFLNFFKTQPFDEGTDELCGKLMAELEKKGEAVEFRDVAIAATALRGGGHILTLNKKHFEKIPGIVIRN